MTACALMTALTAVLAQIAIPVPLGVPITLQTFAVALCGYFLGLKFGVLSTLIYILLGAVGVPVFTHFQGGLHYIFASPTGGFILGFLFVPLFSGLSPLFKWKKHGKATAVLLGVIGVIFCHLCGVMQYSSITAIPFTTSALTVSLPFIIKDIISALLAYFLSERLKKIYAKF